MRREDHRSPAQHPAGSHRHEPRSVRGSHQMHPGEIHHGSGESDRVEVSLPRLTVAQRNNLERPRSPRHGKRRGGADCHAVGINRAMAASSRLNTSRRHVGKSCDRPDCCGCHGNEPLLSTVRLPSPQSWVKEHGPNYEGLPIKLLEWMHHGFVIGANMKVNPASPASTSTPDTPISTAATSAIDSPAEGHSSGWPRGACSYELDHSFSTAIPLTSQRQAALSSPSGGDSLLQRSDVHKRRDFQHMGSLAGLEVLQAARPLWPAAPAGAAPLARRRPTRVRPLKEQPTYVHFSYLVLSRSLTAVRHVP